MSLFARDNYLSTPAGLLAQYRQRRRRRFHFSIDDVEPRAKESMSERDKDEVQKQLLKQLSDLRRRAFRGSLTMRLMLSTSEKTPTHSHHITKNLLDLFSKPRTRLATGRRSLLYADDSQIHALAVTCRHGEVAPSIKAEAGPLGSLLTDLDLATHSERERDDDRHDWDNSRRFDEAMDRFNETLRDEADFRRRFGDQAFEGFLRVARQEAQEYLLGRAALRPLDLSMMYDISGRALGLDVADMWERMFVSTPLRISLSELPQVKGASEVWRQEIDQKLHSFRAQFGRLIDPLVVPVALEVVIKPPPPSRQRGLHDLDNVLRSYLIPRVVAILNPISHHAFAFDTGAMKRDAPALLSDLPSEWKSRLAKPPASTRVGVTRYEVWRLPPCSEGSRGFVSVAIVSDMTGYGDVFGKIDDEIEEWAESLERH